MNVSCRKDWEVVFRRPQSGGWPGLIEFEVFLFGCCAEIPSFFPFGLFDFFTPYGQQAHDLVFLVIVHLLPVETFFPAAQAADAVAFVVGAADADAGAGDGEEVGLFHVFRRPFPACRGVRR